MSRTTHTTDAATAAPLGDVLETPTPAPGLPGENSRLTGTLDTIEQLGTFFTSPTGIGLLVLVGVSLAVIAYLVGLHLPRPGFASLAEIRREMGARHAREMVRQTRPSLAGRERKVPTTDYAVPLGRLRSGPGVGIWGTPEQNYLLLAPSRQGKSIILNSMIYQWPGAVVHTSSKVADHLATKALRERLGPVWVWDPLGLSGDKQLNTFRWDPVIGCEDRSVAIQRAAYLLYGSRSNAGASVEEFFKSTACEVLARFMNAAAIGGKTMMDVYAWSQNRADATAANILVESGAEPGWTGVLVARQNVVQGTGDGIFTTLSNALAWMADPKIARTVLPGPGEHFDAEAFLLGRGTLYLLGSKNPGSAVAPLYVMFADYLRSVAIRLGNRTEHGRMDPPCLWALDEVANIVPLPADQWMTDSGGRGLTLVLVIQSRSQLYDTWGSERGRVIWDDANVRIFLRGIGDKAVRDDISAMCGTYEKKRKTTTRRGGEVSVSEVTEEKPVMPQDKIFKLNKRESLVIFAGCSPVLTRIRPLWQRRDVKKLTAEAAVPAQRAAEDAEDDSPVLLAKGGR